DNVELLLAPLSEQHRIVAAIEQQFSRLDAAVTSLHHAKSKLKRQRAAILKAAVEGTLTADGRAQHPASETAEQLLQRILHERRAKWEAEQLTKMLAKGVTPKDDSWKKAYKEPEPPDTEDLPELPEGWMWATIEQLADVGTGATPLRGRSEYYMGGKIPWVTSGALNADAVTSADEFITGKALIETNAKIFPSGTLLLAMYGEGKTRGKVSELKIDAATNQACAALVFRTLSMICQPYIKYFLLSNYYEIRRLSVGGVQPNLNLSIVKETLIPFPPLAEQNQIVSEVEARLSIIAQTELEVEANLKRAERLRQTILVEAFAGRLVAQEAGDEPASVLLERIRREREGMRKKGKNGNGRKAVSVPDEPVEIDVEAVEQVALWEGVGG
ncbi:MAG TPA: restriction endonuclease subunit S, partial [Chthonomonadales bacterium]|nr:restriction endonuclease subunit S [Chthonomonadales bacterium]